MIEIKELKQRITLLDDESIVSSNELSSVVERIEMLILENKIEKDTFIRNITQLIDDLESSQRLKQKKINVNPIVNLIELIDSVTDEKIKGYAYSETYQQKESLDRSIKSNFSAIKNSIKNIDTPSDHFEYRELEDGIQIIKYTGTEQNDIQIPESIKGIPITSLANRSFISILFNRNEFKNIMLPNSLTNIGDRAFEGCEYLEDINLPDSLEHIGKGAFKDCYNLKYVKLPDKLTNIPEYCFSNCQNLEFVVIPDNIKSIEEYAFKSHKTINILLKGETIKLHSHCFSTSKVILYISNQIILNDLQEFLKYNRSHCSIINHNNIFEIKLKNFKEKKNEKLYS